MISRDKNEQFASRSVLIPHPELIVPVFGDDFLVVLGGYFELFVGGCVLDFVEQDALFQADVIVQFLFDDLQCTGDVILLGEQRLQSAVLGDSLDDQFVVFPEDGEDIIISRGDGADVRLVPVVKIPDQPRKGGGLKGVLHIKENFDDPLPEFEAYS